MAIFKPRYGLTAKEIYTLYENNWRTKVLQQESQWQSFDDFLIWAAQGYKPQAHLRRIRTSLPYGPNNCYWDYPDTVPKQYPEEHPCGKCQMEAYCIHPCPERLRYWDESMAKLRPVFAAAAGKKEVICIEKI